MAKISVVIITFNEERNISRCIKSVEGVADEIIVVDSLSSDKTIEISESLGAKVICQAFLGYAEQKNFANKQASFDYILSLDADEALSSELKKELLRIKDSLFPENVYEMNRKTNYCGSWINHSGWYPDRKIRLFHRGKAYWGGGAVHEKLLFSNDVIVKRLNADILHYSYYSLEEHVRQLDKFSSIAAKELFEKNKKVSVFKLISSSTTRFLSHYIWKLGFLDGYAGYRIARMEGYASFLKYAKLKELQTFKLRNKDGINI